MSEPPTYVRRVLATALSETTRFAKHKLLIGTCVAVVTIMVRLRLALWHFHRLTMTWDEVWISLLVAVSSVATVALGSLIVNLFRATALLDKERVGEIKALTSQLKLAQPSKNQEEISEGLAALMKREGELYGQLVGAPNGAEFSKSVAESKDWISQIIELLNDARLPTDAEAFSQVGGL